MIGLLKGVFLVKRPLVVGRRGVGDTSTVRSVIVADEQKGADDHCVSGLFVPLRQSEINNDGAPPFRSQCRRCAQAPGGRG